MVRKHRLRRVLAADFFVQGNIHINIAAAAYTPEITAALEPFVFELVGVYSGTCCRAAECLQRP